MPEDNKKSISLMRNVFRALANQISFKKWFTWKRKWRV